MGLSIRSASLDLPPHPSPYPFDPPKVGGGGGGWGKVILLRDNHIKAFSAVEVSIFVVGRLKRKKKKARGFPPSHRPPRAFYFLDIGIPNRSICSGERYHRE